MNTKTQTTPEPQKRQTAYKTDIKTLKTGQYIQQEGWQPNYINSNNKKISRANIIAVIISEPIRDENSTHFVIDDGTENIQVRKFEKETAELKMGDMINIIGRPREYNSERYLIPEIIKKIQKPKWAQVRKKELEIEQTKIQEKHKINTQPKKETVQEEIITTDEQDDFQKIINTIKQQDQGNGAIFEEVIKQAQVQKAEQIITNLLKEGELFEIAPGKLKVLE